MKTITIKRAQEICSHWHDGQYSAFYQFASSGIFTIENVLRYLQECENNLHPEYNLHPSILSVKNNKELNSLKSFFIKTANDNKIYIGWETHPVYGYEIPFISGATSQSIIDKVVGLRYAI